MLKHIIVSLMVGAATAPLAAAAPELPSSSAGQHVKFDVHEGTSMAVSVSPDGKMLAIDLQGSIWVLPAKGGRAQRITDLYNDARQPVWAPDGKSIAYFAYRDGGYDLWSIAPDGSNRKKLTGGPYDDRDPSWAPDGRTVAFASDREGKGPATYHIWTLDVATGAVRQVTSGEGEDRLPSFSPDGGEIAYSSLRGTAMAVYATPAAGGAERLLRQADGRMDAPSYGPKGQLASVLADKTGSHLLLDGKAVSGGENVFPFRVSWRPGAGDFYYVSDGRIRHMIGGKATTIPFTAELEVVRPEYARAKRDFDSTAPRKALGILKPHISPDGQNIAFIALGDLWTVPVAGGKPTNLTNDHAMDADPDWSPDGTKLAWTSDHGGGLPQLWVRDMKSGQAKRLTNMDTQPLGAAWSPDGTRIAFIDVDGRWGVAGLCVIDVASGKVTRLAPQLPQPGEPTWSADSTKVAISLSKLFSKSFREGTNQVYVFNADGSGKPVWQVPDANFSIDTRGGGGPAWSPDGTKMAAIYEGLVKIWPVAADGTPLASPRSFTSEMSHFPTWTGDSKTILYQAGDQLKTIEVETGAIKAVPIDLSYVYAKPSGRVIVHVSGLVDAVHDETKADQDIVIEGNRIVSIGPRDAALEKTGTLVDGIGLTAIPGLVEHHAHAQKDFGAAGWRSWLAYGITTLRDPGNQLYDGIENREAVDAGVRIGPRVYAGSPLLEWGRVFYKMGIAVSGPAHLERELSLARALHYDLLKSYVRMPDFGQRRIVEVAHEIGIPVTGHEIYPAAFSGVDATEHTGATSRRGYSPKQGPQGRAYEDVIQLFGQSRRTLTPTLFGSIGPFFDKHPDFKSDPRLALYPKWAQEETVGSGEALLTILGPLLKGSEQMTKDAHDAGALITAGTDTPIAINLHAEIAAYVDAGFTPFEALKTATANPAKDMNLDAGTLEPGKLADIVLVEGDPRKDITATFKVRKVIANGRPYEMAELLDTSKD